MNNNKVEFIVSLKNKANQRIVCGWKGCPGTIFIGMGSSYKCFNCGHIYQVSELDFIYWELCGKYLTPALNLKSKEEQK